MNRSESLKEFIPAFVAAQIKIKGALKDSKNPYYGSMYADLSSVMGACKAPLNEHGIAIIQASAKAEQPDHIAIETVLMHTSCEFISSVMEMPLMRPKTSDPVSAGSKPAKEKQFNESQAFGSALTYLRRYSLAAIVGVCPEDDDAEATTKEIKTSGTTEREIVPADDVPQF